MLSTIVNRNVDGENSHLVPGFKCNIYYLTPLNMMSNTGFIDILNALLG